MAQSREQRLARRRLTNNARRDRLRQELGPSFRRHEGDSLKQRRAEERTAMLAARPACSWCGGPLYIPKTGPVPEMCSKKCRQAAWYKAREEERAAAGKCACGADRIDGHTRCQPCHDKANGASRASQARAKRARLAAEQQAPKPPRYGLVKLPPASTLVVPPPPLVPAPAPPVPAFAVEQIAGERDLFYCIPYRAKLMAGACVRRQHVADPEKRRAMSAQERFSLGSPDAYGRCRDCGLGRAVAARLQASPAPGPVRLPVLQEEPPAGAPPPRTKPLVRPRQQSTFIVFRGPSAFDGAPIIGVVTGAHSSVSHGATKNAKLGAMAQLHILRADASPSVAKRTGRDASVCGDCALRNGRAGIRCYVDVAHGTTTLWKAHAWRPVELEACSQALRRHGLSLRLGAYGDPAALPEAVVEQLVTASAGATGYTHDWRAPRSAWLRQYAMASIERDADLDEARGQGWRTYRIVVPVGRMVELDAEEILCPAVTSDVQCTDCGLCDGARPGDARKVIAIPVHGRQSLPLRRSA